MRLVSAVLLSTILAGSASAGVIVGPSSFPNGPGYPDTSWGIQFTALRNVLLTGFDFHHRAGQGVTPSGTITVFDVTASMSAYTTPWGPDNSGLVSFAGLTVPLTTGHVYQLTATSTAGSTDERFQYQQSGQFLFPTSNADISVTKGVFSNSDAFTNNNAWAAFGNITTAVAPVPEPATLLVFGGLALAGAVGYRRRKA